MTKISNISMCDIYIDWGSSKDRHYTRICTKYLQTANTVEENGIGYREGEGVGGKEGSTPQNVLYLCADHLLSPLPIFKSSSELNR